LQFRSVGRNGDFFEPRFKKISVATNRAELQPISLFDKMRE